MHTPVMRAMPRLRTATTHTSLSTNLEALRRAYSPVAIVHYRSRQRRVELRAAVEEVVDNIRWPSAQAGRCRKPWHGPAFTSVPRCRYRGDMPQAAAVYARISADKDGTQLGVKR